MGSGWAGTASSGRRHLRRPPRRHRPDALRRALTDGIGHGKAYGCGLLTSARDTG
ncbi:type I-E CRISPR-associated protein Cas6/Cse3/CasE [Streptomyces mutabilis]|uniref:type I-E CRISPR-associated protein Cas6/Cse3/CasE n=1 Tax=Streptomyces mutabilis TaxID=67332 RepID=UPI00099BF3A8